MTSQATRVLFLAVIDRTYVPSRFGTDSYFFRWWVLVWLGRVYIILLFDLYVNCLPRPKGEHCGIHFSLDS